MTVQEKEIGKKKQLTNIEKSKETEIKLNQRKK